MAPNASFLTLRERITRLCSTADKPVVLLIDEVDLASGYPVFLDFLGMLRAGYLQSKREATFQSVIFAGLADIRNLKGKARTEEEYNAHSPWNIADEFDVDMSFSAEEIAGMLREYEADHRTGMDIQTVSRELRRLTSGYPYLVSWLCRWLDTEGGRNWTAEGVQAAGRAFTQSGCLLLDKLQWDMENYPELKEVLINILYSGADYAFKPFRAPIEFGVMHGYLKDDGANRTMISNLLFEEYIHEYGRNHDPEMGK